MTSGSMRLRGGQDRDPLGSSVLCNMVREEVQQRRPPPPPQARSGQRQPEGGRLVFPLSRADETLSRAVAGKQAGAHRWEPRTAPESRLACLSAHPGQGCKGQGPPGVDRHADLRSPSSTASPPHTQAIPRCIAGGSQEETAHALRRLDLGVHSADSRARGPAASDAPGR